jgi:hypothetical protein
VIEQLPKSQTLTVGSTAGFEVNNVVEGATSSAKGIVASVTDATHLVVVNTVAGRSLPGGAPTPPPSLPGLIERQAGTGIPDAGGTTAFAVETLIGPTVTTAISAVADLAPAAVTDWDEQMFGPVNGYPSCVEIHRNRLCSPAFRRRRIT